MELYHVSKDHIEVAPSVGKIKKRNLFKKFSKESIKFN